MFSIELTIEEGDLNADYRHLHHAHALLLLEKARIAYLAHIGFSSEYLIANDYLPVITSVNIRYLRELFAGPVRVTCEPVRVLGKTLLLIQQIFNERDKCAVEADVQSMLMSQVKKRGVAPPPGFIEAFLAQTK